jgi:hypothetical protein
VISAKPFQKLPQNRPLGFNRQDATWGWAVANEVDAMGFKWMWTDRSNKHIPFEWSGP